MKNRLPYVLARIENLAEKILKHRKKGNQHKENKNRKELEHELALFHALLNERFPGDEDLLKQKYSDAAASFTQSTMKRLTEDEPDVFYAQGKALIEQLLAEDKQ